MGCLITDIGVDRKVGGCCAADATAGGGGRVGAAPLRQKMLVISSEKNKTLPAQMAPEIWENTFDLRKELSDERSLKETGR